MAQTNQPSGTDVGGGSVTLPPGFDEWIQGLAGGNTWQSPWGDVPEGVAGDTLVDPTTGDIPNFLNTPFGALPVDVGDNQGSPSFWQAVASGEAPWYYPNVRPDRPWGAWNPPQVPAMNFGSSYTPWMPGMMPPWGAAGGGPEGGFGGPWMPQPGPFFPGKGVGYGGSATATPRPGTMPTGGPPGQGPTGPVDLPWAPGPGFTMPGGQPWPGAGDVGGGPGGAPGSYPGYDQGVQPPVGIYDRYQAGRDAMQETIDQAIGGAIAGAGFGGNRYGTAAANAAGRVGQDAAALLNRDFMDMLYQQGQQDLNRQLQATGMGLQNQQFLSQLQAQNLNQGLDRLLRGGELGLSAGRDWENQIANRINTLFNMGQGETQRQDAIDQLLLNAYQQDKYGFMPQLSSFVSGAPIPQAEPIVTQTGGKPNELLQWASVIGPIIAGAMASDERLKEDIAPTGMWLTPELELKTWRWQHSGQPGLGLIAQDVERWKPDAVFEVPAGTKMIDTARLISGLQEVH